MNAMWVSLRELARTIRIVSRNWPRTIRALLVVAAGCAALLALMDTFARIGGF
jgi:hypothetical protein